MLAIPAKARRWIRYALLAGALVSAYFLNVEVQSYLGRRALAETQLVSLPLSDALAQAKARAKPVLVDVSAIWCPTCRSLDREVFANPEVRRRLKAGYLFSRLEYESDDGQAFLKEHAASGFPTLWLLDGEGRVLKRLSVTLDPQAFLQQL
ncbi:MAG: thioredoxin family protein [Opitutaceae bacterium]|jgi:thiol:disulfide interchange protein